MDNARFEYAYNMPRNGCNYFVQHPLAKGFAYSDGVKECAEAGCYWLLDILGTEMLTEEISPQGLMSIVHITVENNKARIEGSLSDDAPSQYARTIEWTDMPEGVWMFYLTNDDGTRRLILPSEY